MEAPAATLVLAVVGGAFAGFVLGFVYLALLRRSVADYTTAAPIWAALVWTALRFGAAFVVFWLLVQWSAAAAIAGLLGFTLAQLRLRTSTEPN
jgi:hypothetical protein